MPRKYLQLPFFVSGLLLTLGGPQNPLRLRGVAVRPHSFFFDGLWDGLMWYFVGFLNIVKPASYHLYYHGLGNNGPYRLGFIIGLLVITAVIVTVLRSLSDGWLFPGPIVVVIVVILLLLALRT